MIPIPFHINQFTQQIQQSIERKKTWALVTMPYINGSTNVHILDMSIGHNDRLPFCNKVIAVHNQEAKRRSTSILRGNNSHI